MPEEPLHPFQRQERGLDRGQGLDAQQAVRRLAFAVDRLRRVTATSSNALPGGADDAPTDETPVKLRDAHRKIKGLARRSSDDCP